MNKHLLFLLCLATIVGCKTQKMAEEATDVAEAGHDHNHVLANQKDSVSYAIGLNLAESIQKAGLTDLNFDVLNQAMQDVIVNKHVIMSSDDASNTVNNYMRTKAAKEEIAAQAAQVAFLAVNAKNKGVIELDNGLQYKIIKQGKGVIPVDGQKVKTHYEGRLINGDIFDSSYERGSPTSFGVNQVIPGWTQILKMMPVGSEYEVYIPYELAYGSRAMGAKIPAYSTLIFKMELLDIVEQN